MGQCSPHEHLSVTCFGVTITWGITAIWGGVSVFMMGVGAGVGRIGQSFLVSNRFSNPALGQGIPCLTGTLGMSSSGEGLEFWVEECPSSWGLSVW